MFHLSNIIEKFLDNSTNILKSSKTTYNISMLRNLLILFSQEISIVEL